MSRTRTASLVLGSGDRLTLSFTPLDEHVAEVSINVTVAGQTIGTASEMAPEALDAFVRQLRDLHRSLSGTADVQDYFGRVALVLRVTDPRRGALTLAGEIFKEVHGYAAGGGCPGLTIRLEQLPLDQSALPEFIEALSDDDE